ncbi:MAG: cytochrome P450, partial [Actinobacteria bacterium]|nr:cytochrome P450 [Actinomycetota bacterium]
MSPRSRRPPERYFRTPVTAPGPQGGEMLRAFGLIRGNPLAFLEQVWQQHGDLVQFPIPKPPSYLVTDPEAVDRVLRVNQRAYGKRTIQYTSLSLVTGEGLLTADTEAWRQQRRVVQPSFHHSQVERVADHVGVACQRLDHEWSELPAGAVVDVDAAMMHVALEVVGRALFGTDLSGDAARLAHATLDALEVVVGKARNPLSPPLWVPTPGNLTLRRSLSVLDSAVARMLDERRVRPVGVAREPDMLDLLVEGFGTAPGDTRVRDQIITFLVAGHETVASALTWAWHLLGSAPHAATALR